jgi:hypothetical protein
LAPQIPSCEPTSFVAGDTVQWTKPLNDYPSSDGWALKYRFVGDPQLNGGTAYTADVVNGEFAVTIPSAHTVGIVSDALYRLIGWVELSGARYTVFDGTVTAFANLAASTAEDLQTTAEKQLALVDAAIEARLSGDGIESHSVDGRSYQLMPMTELVALRSALAVRVHRERGGGMITHQVRHRAVR